MKKKSLVGMALAVVLVATLTVGSMTVLAANPFTAFLDNFRGAAERTEMTVVDAEGRETAVDSGQLRRPLGRITINADGSVNEIHDDHLDSLFDRLGVPPLPLADAFDISREGAERTVASFGTLEEANAFANPVVPSPAFTDEELSQIIAEIESGERPINGRFTEDGTFVFYNVPEMAAGRDLEGAELTVTFITADGVTKSGSAVFPGQ